MGDTNRAVAETTMNATSSRSHCVFTASLESRPVVAATLRRSKLHLVDLAGSERVSKTGASGNTLNEALCINTSLHFLEMVIVALQERERKGRLHIPYRNSMLTSVLRDSLGGNCKTVMVATMHPGLAHTDESISTCRFAQRVAKVTNVAEINEEVDQAALIEKLKQENRKLREEGGMADDAAEVQLGPEELASLHAALRAFVRDPDAHATVTPDPNPDPNPNPDPDPNPNSDPDPDPDPNPNPNRNPNLTLTQILSLTLTLALALALTLPR